MGEGLKHFYHFATFPGTMCMWFSFFFRKEIRKSLNILQTSGHYSEPTSTFFTHYVLGGSTCVSLSLVINVGYYFLVHFTNEEGGTQR